MIQEEKELLLKDLCARLPYHTKCYNISTEVDFELSDVTDIDTGYPSFDYGYAKIEDIKPYLRQMSSMTSEEEEEFFDLCTFKHSDGFTIDECCGSNLMLEKFDWLNKHHFDYRNLIERRLAIEAPENMYNVKKQ